LVSNKNKNITQYNQNINKNNKNINKLYYNHQERKLLIIIRTTNK